MGTLPILTSGKPARMAWTQYLVSPAAYGLWMGHGARDVARARLSALREYLNTPHTNQVGKVRDRADQSLAPASPTAGAELGEFVRRQLNSIACPALVRDTPLQYVHAVNSACTQMFAGLEPTGPGERPVNYLEWLFFHPGAQVIEPSDRFANIRALLHQLRLEAPGTVHPAAIEAVLAPLRRSPDFDRLWNPASEENATTLEKPRSVRLRDSTGAQAVFSVMTTRIQFSNLETCYLMRQPQPSVTATQSDATGAV